MRQKSFGSHEVSNVNVCTLLV